MNIQELIKYHLSKPSHIVKIEDKENDLRLRKDRRYLKNAYSFDDIITEFGSIDNLLKELLARGFKNVTFTFQRTYGEGIKTTYHTMKTETINLEEQKSTIPAFTQSPAMLPSFLGNPQQMLGAMIQSERAGDYKKQVEELKEDVKDYRSKIRRLEDENHSLKLKVETAEEKSELKIQKALLEKESVFESKGFQKIAEGLGGVLPHIIPAMVNNGTTPAQLGGADLSAIKQQAIALIRQSDDKNVAFIFYVLQNMNEELMQLIKKHIENGKGN